MGSVAIPTSSGNNLELVSSTKPSMTLNMVATHNATLLVVTCYLYGGPILPTFSKTPEFQYRYDRAFTFTFRNVKQGDSILTYNSSSKPWNDERTANSQTALYYN